MEEAAPRAAPLQRLGPALRAVLGCDPKALRRAIDLRAAGDGDWARGIPDAIRRASLVLGQPPSQSLPAGVGG